MYIHLSIYTYLNKNLKSGTHKKTYTGHDLLRIEKAIGGLKETDRQTDRQIDRETQRNTETQKERQRQRQR